mmetsp:Transcript_31592/g.70294  ORF Transcript_31592/g.70294 Transcript_31592/m.70294 type:complete len:90 (-) Transcript_31592:595-864(-)
MRKLLKSSSQLHCVSELMKVQGVSFSGGNGGLGVSSKSSRMSINGIQIRISSDGGGCVLGCSNLRTYTGIQCGAQGVWTWDQAVKRLFV